MDFPKSVKGRILTEKAPIYRGPSPNATEKGLMQNFNFC
jgi:hypothetical protein